MKVLIDDYRDLPVDLICRNYEAGLAILKNKLATELYLDHYLGNGKTGYDLLKELERLKQAEDIDLFPKKIILVTSSPIGRKNMTQLLLVNGYIYNWGTHEFFKRG